MMKGGKEDSETLPVTGVQLAYPPPPNQHRFQVSLPRSIASRVDQSQLSPQDDAAATLSQERLVCKRKCAAMSRMALMLFNDLFRLAAGDPRPRMGWIGWMDNKRRGKRKEDRESDHAGEFAGW